MDTGSDKRAEASKDSVVFTLPTSSNYQGFFILANAIATRGSSTGAANLAEIGTNAILVGWEYLDSPASILSKKIEINLNTANVGTGVGV